MRVDISLTLGKNLNNCIISINGEVWGHKTSLISQLFIETCIKEREWSCVGGNMYQEEGVVMCRG